MPAAVAWIIDLPCDLRAAVGGAELVHVLPDTPRRTPIADGPVYMHEAIAWDAGLVPVFDTARLSEGVAKSADCVYFGIVRFRTDHTGPQRFGALKLTAIPKRVSVDDQMACDLPDFYERFRKFSISCFEFDGYPVPVLNLARIFSAVPSPTDMRAAAGESAGSAEGGNGRDPDGYTDSLATT